MLNRFRNSYLFFFTKEVEIKNLIIIGLLYRFLIFTIFYTQITKFPDSWGFVELKDYLLRFTLEKYNGQRSLGYPFLIFLAFGKLWLTVVYQFILGVVTSIVWYKTFIKLQFNKKSSFYFALFLESFLYVFFYETSILIEPIALFFTSLLVFQFANGYFENHSFKKDILVGFILGYLVLIKPFFAYLAFLIYFLYIIKNWKLVFVKLNILFFTLAAYFGWSYVNKINTGYFVSTTFFGLNLSQNCVYFAEKGPTEYDWIMKPYVEQREISIRDNLDVSMTVWRAYDKNYQYEYSNFPELSAKLGDYAIKTIKANPKEYAYQVVFRSWLDYWKTFMPWQYDHFNFKFANKLFNGVWYIQLALIYFFVFLFFYITPIHLIRFIKSKNITFEMVCIALIWVNSILQAVVTYGTNSKYSYPFDFTMIIVGLLYIREKNWFPKRLHTFLQ